VLERRNVFFTGSAGTGKSVLIRAIVRVFNKHFEEEKAKRLEDFNNGGRSKRSRSSRAQNGQDAGVRVQRWKLGVTASTGMAAL
jgi:ATP-dependent DNA helicase PIF1